jgi:hypothetical protein
MNIETTSIIFGISAGAVQLVGYVVYNWRASGKINTGSWSMWALAGLLDFASYFALTKGDWVVNILPAVCGVAALGTFIYALLKGRHDWPDRLDQTLIGVDIGITAVWYYSNEVVANLLYQLTNIFSFTPMYRGLLAGREVEKLAPWLIWTAAYILLTVSATLRLDRWEELVYPISHAITHLIVVGIVCKLSWTQKPVLS